MSRIQDKPERQVAARFSGSIATVANVLAVSMALAAGLVMIFTGLGVDTFDGDEHNSITFLTEGLWEYITTFHYGHLFKLQFWVLHEFFGNSFFWYRVPAALSATATLAWLGLFRVGGFPANRIGQAIVVLALAGNAAFLDFGRWGIPNYAQAILVCTVLVSLVLADVMKGRAPQWGWGRLLLVFILPWLHPAVILLLGGISVYLLLETMIRQWLSGSITGATRAGLRALVPVTLGGASLVLVRLSFPDAYWARARSHHQAFKAWQELGGDGGVIGFALDSLANLGGQFLQLTPLAADSKYQWVASAYSGFVLLLAMTVVAALVVAGWRVYRMRNCMSGVDVGFLRGATFLLTSLGAAIAVAIVAAVFEQFPMIAFRHLFFVITLPALLSAIALAYLGHVARQGSNHRDRLARTGTLIGLLVLAGLGIALALAVVTQRRVEAGKYRAIHAILQSAGNDIFFSWAPGFYFAEATLGQESRFFQVDRGTRLPESLAHAISMEQRSLDGGTIAIFTTATMTAGSDSPLGVLVHKFGLRLEREAGYNNYRALALKIPSQGMVDPADRTIEVTVDLPVSNIVSVRFDPTDYLRAKVTIDSMVYIDDHGERMVDVCGKPLASMRTARVFGDDSCSFIFGNSENTGWIAPSDLNDLGAGGPRQVRVRMTGDLGDEFRVYLDTGSGYSSPIRINVDPVASQ